jgi:hypothetical protein
MISHIPHLLAGHLRKPRQAAERRAGGDASDRALQRAAPVAGCLFHMRDMG